MKQQLNNLSLTKKFFGLMLMVFLPIKSNAGFFGPPPSNVFSQMELKNNSISMVEIKSSIEREPELSRDFYLISGVIVRSFDSSSKETLELWSVKCSKNIDPIKIDGFLDSVHYGIPPCKISAPADLSPAKSLVQYGAGKEIIFSVGVIGFDENKKNLIRFSVSSIFNLGIGEDGKIFIVSAAPQSR